MIINFPFHLPNLDSDTRSHTGYLDFRGGGTLIEKQSFDKRVIYSWPQKTGSRWTLPAMEVQRGVYSRSSSVAAGGGSEAWYVGVLDYKFVCTWTQRDPSIDTHKKGVQYSHPTDLRSALKKTD